MARVVQVVRVVRVVRMIGPDVMHSENVNSFQGLTHRTIAES